MRRPRRVMKGVVCVRIRPTRSELRSTTTVVVSTRVSFFFLVLLSPFNAPLLAVAWMLIWGHSTVLWDNTGISVWFFPRQNIPSDIAASAPVPANWGTPSSFWPENTCNPFEIFKNQAAIFDTTLCGDWAGSVWTATGVPGQEQSCAQRTGVPTCEQFVQQNGAALSQACKSLPLAPFAPRCITCDAVLFGSC